MRKEIFRRKSIERLNNPDELDQCIHVIPPSVWIVLVAVAAIIIGVCVWSVFGVLKIEDTCVAYATKGLVYLYQPATTEYHIDMNTECYIDGKENIPIHLETVDVKLTIRDVLDVYENLKFDVASEYDFSEWLTDLLTLLPGHDKHDYHELYVSAGRTDTKLDDGFYLAHIVFKSASLYKLMFS